MMQKTGWTTVGQALIGLALMAMLCADGSAQTRRPRRETKRIVGETTHFWGVSASFNGISGFHYEWGLRNKSGAVSRSTFAVAAGYSSRLASFENEVTFNESSEWVHGAGMGIMFNNYITSPDEGLVWALGISGQIFFKHTDKPEKFSNQLKNYAVFGHVGYRLKSGTRMVVTPVLGVGIMGSSFKSSTSSDINGLYGSLGASLSLKRN